MRTNGGVESRHPQAAKKVTVLGIALCLAILLGPARANGFSLLGPFAPWMDVEKGYHQGNAIGGPMNITEGYRWNVPTLTYGFDRSFLDFFGSNGVAAVEEAIGMLNDIPPASVMDLQRYPTAGALRTNYRAESMALIDLKSQTLAFLLEQLGLADPYQYTFCIREFQPYPGGDYHFDVVHRNFDSVTAQPSSYVNGMLLSYFVLEFGAVPIPEQLFCDAYEVTVDAAADWYYPVLTLARHDPSYLNPFGLYVTNLTREDVAGLRFLLSANQARCESLPPDVHLVNTNGGELVVTAVRPGIEKLTFVRHPTGTLSGQFLPFTNRWTDIYYGYFFPGYQDVERVTTQPDIVFTARDLGPSHTIARSGTTNWVNNAGLNGNAGGSGPGVIQGPVTIAYNSVGPIHALFGRINTNVFLSEVDAIVIAGWGSFEGGTNMPVIYPSGQLPFQPTQIHLQLNLAGTSHELRWPVSGRPYGRFILQTSTNFTDWAALTTLTNSSGTFEYWYDASPGEPARFFRTVPQ